ncbi:hypothetical protein WDW89_02845 [Deltaproteobacteria bacterium TL4]
MKNIQIKNISIKIYCLIFLMILGLFFLSCDDSPSGGDSSPTPTESNETSTNEETSTTTADNTTIPVENAGTSDSSSDTGNTVPTPSKCTLDKIEKVSCPMLNGIRRTIENL